MPRIRFTRNYKVKPDGPSYKVDQVVEVDVASAKHFTDRQAAVLVKDEEPKRAEKPAPAAPAGK